MNVSVLQNCMVCQKIKQESIKMEHTEQSKMLLKHQKQQIFPAQKIHNKTEPKVCY